MPFSDIHFGKTLNNLTFQDIENYFLEEHIETDQLEFKSFSGKVEDNFPGLIKTICGFLNSKGGLLIWGAPLGRELPGKKEKVFTGELSPINKAIEKDRLISKCSDSITPLPSDIRARSINNGSGLFVYVFEVEESNYSPHQINGKYYMRLDGQTRVAPHHYIEALFRKIRFPELEGYIKLKAIKVGTVFSIDFDCIFFNWSPLQNEEHLFYRVITDCGRFPKVQPYSYTSDGSELIRDPAKAVFSYGEPLIESWTILAKHEDLEPLYQIRIALAFGGKSSPTKMSTYTINLHNCNLTEPERNVSKRDENILTKDGQDNKGVTREFILNKLLGR